MKILIYLTGGVHWLGGVQYTRNLLRALSLLPASELPNIVLQIGRRSSGQGFEEEFSCYPNVVIDRSRGGRFALIYRALSLLRRAQRRFFGSDTPIRALSSDDCAVAFPAKGPNIHGPARNVYWVPDFQYKNFPIFFSDTERQKRDAAYDQMFAEEGILVLSSEAVKKDFERFFPKHKSKTVRILHFCTIIDDDDYALDPIRICADFGLPEKFIYLPNQMWQHKGFETVFEALGMLRRQGLIFPLVCTGNSEDYRKSSYFNELLELIDTHQLASQIHLLGMLPRRTQIQLYRRAAVVLQPSRFEGWSTSVEDARALGKPIILSDLDAHKEQHPPDATFFVAGDVMDLARKLTQFWPEARPGPDLSSEQLAREHIGPRALAFARTFMSIMSEADVSKRMDLMSKSDLAAEELKVAALHHLLHETLTDEYFGPSYSKMLRRKREVLHPAGQVDIRRVPTKMGLQFNVNLGDRLGCDLYYGVFNEQTDWELFLALISPGDVVIDVGANMGIYSLSSAMRAGPTGLVVAFEPDSRSYKMLEGNVALNSSVGNISLCAYCLGDYNGTIPFYEAAEPCLSGTLDTARTPIHEVCEVPIRKLDDVLAEMGIPRVSMIKIDVEGAEHKVILGALRALESSDAILMMEISPKNLSEQSVLDLKQCLSTLETRFGYQAFRISSNLLKLIAYDRMEDIFSSANGIFGANYFLARRDGERATLVQNRFSKVSKFSNQPNRFFKSRFVDSLDLSKSETEAMLWAERQRGLLAQRRITIAYQRMESAANRPRGLSSHE
jgi:FkbM family methyltransferase